VIDVKNLKKSFGDVHVLKGITTHVNKGECICIIGPSGSGKSTFLRCLNLLEKPEEGEITVNGQQLLDPKLDVDKFRENVGMVFQHFNLFPNMTVLKNITLAPVRLGKWNGTEADQKARALLKRVGLEEKADVYPGKLSGGQKQRVAIARALAMNPQVLLFDEPAAEISRHFQRIYPGEVARGQNLIGPQRDDLTLRLNDMPAREFASNGEMWTMALALKMALYEVVSAQRDVKPIVILDDVFAQLDESRRGQILDFARRQDQVLITVAAASDIPQGEAHVIDVAALRAQSQETDGDIAAMAAMLAAGRGAQSQGIEAES
jgi:ABC-type lipoprotein export system ATPase subunit